MMAISIIRMTAPPPPMMENIFLTLFNPRLPLLWHLDFEELCWLIGDVTG